MTNFTNFLKGNYHDSFFLSPVTVTQVSTIIFKLSTSKYISPNSTRIGLLKRIDNTISIPLSIIINESFFSGTFPDKLKIAKVTPIYKKGSRSAKFNYSPISVVSVFSKIFEKLMYNRLYNYLEFHYIIYERQFGFRNNHSTSHALINMIENLNLNLNLKI